LPEVVPEIDANPVSFYWRRGRGRESFRFGAGLANRIVYVSFNMAVLDFAYTGYK